MISALYVSPHMALTLLTYC